MSLSGAEIRPLCILTQMSAPVLGPQQPMRSEAEAVLTGSCPLYSRGRAWQPQSASCRVHPGSGASCGVHPGSGAYWGPAGGMRSWSGSRQGCPCLGGWEIRWEMGSHSNLGVDYQCGLLLATGQATPEHIFLWVTALSPP